MLEKRTSIFVAAAAFAALAIAPLAQAQMMAPMQPPDRVDLYSDAPKVDPGDNPANWSARQNVVDSERYEQLLRTNAGFRNARIQKECGSINEPDLYQQCIGTFR
jgi:ABC-type transport system substrate-binding protein